MSSIEHHISKDGSSTLYSKRFDQFYHNPNGAISESRHVFFEKSGFIDFLRGNAESVSIFEMGFGTGLNFLILLDYVHEFDVKAPVHFYSVEAFPANLMLIRNINYSESLNLKTANDSLYKIFKDLKRGWNHFSFPSNDHIKLSLFVGYFDDMPEPNTKINYFFHDPFSPEVNSELWTIKTFKKLKIMADNDAVLSTYCAASKARAAMAKAGWFVAKAPGALGKREMTVSSINTKKLIHLKRVNELRLIERFDNGEFDN